MSDIVGFLLAQLDRDEAVAHAALVDHPAPWASLPEADPEDAGDPDPLMREPEVRDAHERVVVYDEGSMGRAAADHIARHDPARVLAEVAAKRAVVGAHRAQRDFDRGGDAKTCTSCADGSEIAYGDAITVWTAWPCVTLRALASVYRGEPGWDESWALTEVGA